MKKFLSALMLVVAFCLTAVAQTNVTGTVIDESHEPLPGASVVVKGESRGVATNVDGQFTVSAKVGDILQVSYVGYQSTEVKVPANGKMQIVLKESSDFL